MPITEEDIRSKLLMPYLADLGLDLSEISLERSFRIRLGRNVHEVDGTAAGRLDVACHRNGKYLFVLEIKRDGLALTEDDRRQGISYARLLDNIAPFVIISNGSNTEVYDTITSKRIDGYRISEASAFWKNGCTLSTPEDLAIRHAALVNFIGRSPENLRIFVQKQVASRMGNITGVAGDIHAKYVKELYIDRDALDGAFGHFLESSFPIFAVIGESGVGKTNAICHLCESQLGSQLTLFYNASVATASLVELIATDLNLFFSAQWDSQKVLTELSNTARDLGQILIFVDAIDECPRGELRYELGEIALALKGIEGVRLCVSCKTAVWESFLYINGIKSYLYDSVYPCASTSVRRPGYVQGPGFELCTFNDGELESVLPLYARSYQLSGPFSGALKEQLRLGIFLRLFSHVHRGQRVPAGIETIALFRNYLETVAAKMTRTTEETVVAVLSAIGKLLISDESHGHSTGNVDTSALKKELGLGQLEEVPAELFDYNLLLKGNQEGTSAVSFYYSLLRDYVICFHTMRLQTLTDTEFDLAIRSMSCGQVGLSAINFYMPHAKPSQRNAIAALWASRLQSFAESYNHILDSHFPGTKESFDPGTNGPIGILVPTDLTAAFGPYALCPADMAGGRALTQTELLSRWDDQVFHLYKARVIHSSYEALLTPDAEGQVWLHVCSQLKDILNKGRLNQFRSETLLREQVANIVYFYQRILHPDITIEDMYYPRYDAIYPIDLADIVSSVNRFFARHYFRDQQVRRLIREGKIRVVNNAYSYSEQQLDSLQIEQEVEAALKGGLPIPEPRVSGSFPPFVHLMKIIRYLKERGIYRLEKHYLPGPDVSVQKARQIFSASGADSIWTSSLIAAQFSREQVGLYVEQFLRTVEKAYIELVDHCFPLLKDKMPFYATRPHRYFVHYEPGKTGNLTLACGTARQTSDVPTVHFVKDEILQIYRKERLDWCWIQEASSIFCASYPELPTVEGIETPKVDEFCVLRKWVYDLVKGDLSKICPQVR